LIVNIRGKERLFCPVRWGGQRLLVHGMLRHCGEMGEEIGKAFRPYFWVYIVFDYVGEGREKERSDEVCTYD